MATTAERVRKWKQQHPEKHRAQLRAYGQRHRKEMNRRSSEWRTMCRRDFNKRPRFLYTNILARVRNYSNSHPSYVGRLCTFTKQQFIDWCLSSPDYRRTFDAWVESSYNPSLAPSIDRIDNTGHYSLDNIQILTLADNGRKGKKVVV